MNILVFGASNSAGDYLADPDAAWPCLLGAALRSAVSHRKLYVTSDTFRDYLDRECASHRADVIILFPATVFALPNPAQTVGDRFGDRARKTYEWLADAISRVPIVAHVGRFVVRRVLPGPTLAVAEACQRYDEVLARLARTDARQVIVMSGGVFSESPRAGIPSLRADVRAFNSHLSERAARHGFSWLDTEQMTTDGGTRVACFHEDGIHLGTEEHARVAAAAAAAQAISGCRAGQPERDPAAEPRMDVVGR